MQEESVPPVENQDFGMTDQEVKNYKVSNFFGRIKYYLQLIEPVIVKIFNMIIYSSLKFIKAFTSTVFKMILGKEV